MRFNRLLVVGGALALCIGVVPAVTIPITPADSIQDAIDLMADNGDIVELAAGTYFQSFNFNEKQITVRGASLNPADTIIDGGGVLHVVQCVSGEGIFTVLENLTITGGGSAGFLVSGGGMYNSGSSPTVTNCIFTGNSAARGGGMANTSDSNPTVTNCTFTENSAFGGDATPHYGGGMANSDDSSPTVTNCVFSGNTAVSGGGMFNSCSNPTLTDCIFNDNSASSPGGGGVYNLDSSPTVAGCVFSGNSSLAAQGGGMLYRLHSALCESSPTVTNCTFNGNVGGGLDIVGFSNTTVTNCTFSNNSGVQGGGMDASGSFGTTVTNCAFADNSASISGGGMITGSEATVTNCTFSGNSANNGGGINIATGFGTTTVTNCTFSGNTAVNGGGVLSGGSPQITNCILWGNAPDQVSAPIATGTFNFCQIQGAGGSGAGWDAAIGIDGGGNIDADPLFVDAAGNDLHVDSFSPCIDAGDNDAVPAGITSDLDGSARFYDDDNVADTGNGTAPTVDMGAYERQVDSVGCPADITGDGAVSSADLVALILNWGCTEPPGPCPGDVTGDGSVNSSDLVALILAWGDC